MHTQQEGMMDNIQKLEQRFLDYSVANLGFWMCTFIVLHNSTQGMRLFFIMYFLIAGLVITATMALFYMLRYLSAEAYARVKQYRIRHP